MQGWLKHIGKLGLPLKIVMVLYQFLIVYWDLMFLALMTYKEMCLSCFYFIVPLPKKTLNTEVAVVSNLQSDVD